MNARLALSLAAFAGLAVAACSPPAPRPAVCRLEGSWLTTASGGQREWTIRPDGSISSRESDQVEGKATLNDHKLTIEFVDGPSAGAYDLTLSPDCTKAEGTVKTTKAPPGWPLTSGPVTAERAGG